MTKLKSTKKNIGISSAHLAELRRATLIASTGSSLRLSGSKVTNEQVVKILNEMSTPSRQK